MYLVGCGLTSHSAIFQLYSDGTVVQFPNFDLLLGTQRHGQLGVFSVPSLPRHGTSLTSLTSEGLNTVRVCRLSIPDLPIHSPARYLYATAAGLYVLKRLLNVQHILEKVMSMQHSFEEFSEKQRRVELISVWNFVAKPVLVESANQFSLEELCRTQYSLKYFSKPYRPSDRLEKPQDKQKSVKIVSINNCA